MSTEAKEFSNCVDELRSRINRITEVSRDIYINTADANILTLVGTMREELASTSRLLLMLDNAAYLLESQTALTAFWRESYRQVTKDEKTPTIAQLPEQISFRIRGDDPLVNQI